VIIFGTPLKLSALSIAEPRAAIGRPSEIYRS
jgi:hypothetical protein